MIIYKRGVAENFCEQLLQNYKNTQTVTFQKQYVII